MGRQTLRAIRPPGTNTRGISRGSAIHVMLVTRFRVTVDQQLSLSRLNHWLPGGEAHPEVVQGTTDLHHQIADAFFPQADAVFHNATTLDTAVDMLDAQPTLVQRLVGPLLLQRQLLAARLLGWHEDLHPRERERQKAQILY